MQLQHTRSFWQRTPLMPLVVTAAVCLGNGSSAALASGQSSPQPVPQATTQTLPEPNRAVQNTVAQIYFVPPRPAVQNRIPPVFQNTVPQPRPFQSRFCPSDLQRAIAAVVDRPAFRTAQWGIVIEPLFEPTSLYRHNADSFLIPASNVKLFTTAAAIRAVEESSPEAFSALRERLMIINRYSDNVYADRLLAQIGGQNTVKRVLAPLGINPNSFRQVDGSGLSRGNLAQPSTLVRLLKSMYSYDRSGLFYYSLPVAGMSGTLQRRFRDTFAQGRVHAKTGTLQGVRALSGYIDNMDYGKIAFSIVVNQPGQSGQVLVDAVDQIVLQSARLNRCF